jgi:hypothetical protein
MGARYLHSSRPVCCLRIPAERVATLRTPPPSPADCMRVAFTRALPKRAEDTVETQARCCSKIPMYDSFARFPRLVLERVAFVHANQPRETTALDTWKLDAALLGNRVEPNLDSQSPRFKLMSFCSVISSIVSLIPSLPKPVFRRPPKGRASHLSLVESLMMTEPARILLARFSAIL